MISWFCQDFHKRTYWAKCMSWHIFMINYSVLLVFKKLLKVSLFISSLSSCLFTVFHQENVYKKRCTVKHKVPLFNSIFCFCCFNIARFVFSLLHIGFVVFCTVLCLMSLCISPYRLFFACDIKSPNLWIHYSIGLGLIAIKISDLCLMFLLIVSNTCWNTFYFDGFMEIIGLWCAISYTQKNISIYTKKYIYI